MTTDRIARWTVAAFTVASMGIVGCGSESSGDSANTSTSTSTSESAGDSTSATVATVATTTPATTLPHADALWAPPGNAALPAATGEALQTAIDTWIEQGKLDGLTAAVVTPDGVWSGAAGVDRAGTELQADSALSLQSVSKTYAAAEVMLLSSRGLVDLDAPVTDYVDVPFDCQGATVRQLLSMRSGFPDFTAETFQALIAADLDREWTVDDVLAAMPADAERPGTVGGTPSYNSVNYAVLAQLIANVTGRSFAEAVRADLLDPAGLERTWTQPAETPTAPLTVGGTTPWADTVDPAGPYMPSRSFTSFVTGGGSIAADAADAARWVYLLYGGHVVDSTRVAEMVADPQDDPNYGPYALGTMVADYNGVAMYGHAGGGADFPYTTVVQVLAGDTPISIAVLASEAADHFTQIFDVFMELYTIVVA